MGEKINDELNNTIKRGILSPIEWSDWASPIVPILRSDGSVRICGDFKVTVKPHINMDSYPVPTIDSMLSTMAGGSKFTKIYLKTAYLQMEVENDCNKLCINIPKGLSIVWHTVLPRTQPFSREQWNKSSQELTTSKSFPMAC